MYSRRWLINGALLVAIAALAWAGIHFDAQRNRAEDRQISTLSPDEVKRIDMQVDGSRLSLHLDSEGWRLSAPIDWPAHSANVRRLLSILKLESSALADAGGVDLAPLGLQPPLAILRLNDTPLLFGATNNIGGRRYVMIESKLYLLPDVHLAFAAQGLAGMVERSLLPRRTDIAAMRLPGIEISRDDKDGEWRSTPIRAQAQLQQLLDNWRTLPASRIRPYQTGAGAFEVIELRFTDAQRMDFLLLSREPEIVIANPGIGLQYHFDADYLGQLISPAADG